MRFLVTTCVSERNKRFSTMRKAVRYARGQSARCERVNVWRTRVAGGNREHGEIVAICKKKTCKPTGWLQRGRNPL